MREGKDTQYRTKTNDRLETSDVPLMVAETIRRVQFIKQFIKLHYSQISLLVGLLTGHLDNLDIESNVLCRYFELKCERPKLILDILQHWAQKKRNCFAGNQLLGANEIRSFSPGKIMDFLKKTTSYNLN